MAHEHHKLPTPTNDNDYFARMSWIIFMSGLNAAVMDKKWPGIKRAFHDFDIDQVAQMEQPDIDELMTNPDIIHNQAKIQAIITNARHLQSILAEHGSVKKYLDTLNHNGQADAIKELSKHFAFIGPGTGHMFLASLGYKSDVSA